MTEVAESDMEVVVSRWNEIVCKSNLTAAGVERKHGFARNQVKRLLLAEVAPNEKSKQRMEKVMKKLQGTSRIAYHPSFGYATPEQIARLKEPISQFDRAAIMKQIEKQTKLRGKID